MASTTLATAGGELHPLDLGDVSPGQRIAEKVPAETSNLSAFYCPRCKASTEAEFYGPCDACRASLRATMRRAPAAPVEPARPSRPAPSIGSAVARKTWRRFAARPTVWVDLDGAYAGDLGAGTVNMGSAGAMLAGLPVEARQVMVAGRPGGGDWAAATTWGDTLAGTWTASGHVLNPDAPVWSYVDSSGRRVDVRTSGRWWGGEVPAAVAAAAWTELGQIIERRFGAGSTLLASPGATGRDLVSRCIPEGADWPTVGDDYAEVIRRASTQGRNEVFAHDGELPQLVEVDARFAYGALCRGLPVGPARHYAGSEVEDQYDRMAQGWYRVDGAAPIGWIGPGLVPQLTSDGWRWPTSGRVSGWVSAVELDLARRHGWRLRVSEAWLHDKHKGPGPLDLWADRLVAGRVEAAGCHPDPAVCDAVAAGCRSILTQTLGAMWVDSVSVTRSTLDPDEVPQGAKGVVFDGDLISWTDVRAPAMAEMVRPEWTATVWARCRARILDGPGPNRCRTGALHVDPAALVAIRTDALYLTADPGWPDDGRVGRLRTKTVYPGPMAPPQDHADLLALRRTNVK